MTGHRPRYRVAFDSYVVVDAETVEDAERLAGKVQEEVEAMYAGRVALPLFDNRVVTDNVTGETVEHH